MKLSCITKKQLGKFSPQLIQTDFLICRSNYSRFICRWKATRITALISSFLEIYVLWLEPRFGLSFQIIDRNECDVSQHIANCMVHKDVLFFASYILLIGAWLHFRGGYYLDFLFYVISRLQNMKTVKKNLGIKVKVLKKLTSFATFRIFMK